MMLTSLITEAFLLICGPLLCGGPQQKVEDVILSVDLAGFLPISSVYTSSTASHASGQLMTKLSQGNSLSINDRSDLKRRITDNPEDWISSRLLIEASRSEKNQLETITFFSDILEKHQDSPGAIYAACLTVSAFISLETYEARYPLFKRIAELVRDIDIAEMSSESIVLFAGLRQYQDPNHIVELRRAALIRHERVPDSSLERILLASVFTVDYNSGSPLEPAPDFEVARSILKPLIKTRPFDGKVAYYKAALEDVAGNSGRAAAYFKTFLANPGDIGWMKNVAQSYVEHGDFKSAGVYYHARRFVRQ